MKDVLQGERGLIKVGRSSIKGKGAIATRLIRPGHFIDTTPINRIGCNHACEPNCMIVRNRRGHNVGFVALRFIKKGEELTCDYRHGQGRSKAFRDPSRIMDMDPVIDDTGTPCNCSKCRRKKTT